MTNFITFEGVDGVGKTVVSQQVAKDLDYYYTSDPRGTNVGGAVADAVLSYNSTDLTRTFAFLAARSQLVSDVIKPVLEYKSVICDRFSDSMIAYQGASSGLSTQQLQDLSLVASGGLKPDLTILLIAHDLHAVQERIFARLHNKEKKLDDFDFMPIERVEAIQKAYLRLAKAEPDRFVTIAVDKVPLEHLCRSVSGTILRKFGENR